MMLLRITDGSQQRRRDDERRGRNERQLKRLDQFMGGNRRGFRLPAARPGEEPEHGFGGNTGSAEGVEPRIAVPFGQAPAVGTDHQRHMGELGRREAEGLIQQQLPRRRGQQVVAANHASHAVVGVVDDDRELIGRRIVGLRHDKIAADFLTSECDGAAEAIGESRRLIDTESPREWPIAERCDVGGTTVGAGAAVNRLGAVRSAGRSLDIRAAARARVHQFARSQFVKRGAVEIQALRLHERSGVPIEAKPAEVVERLIGGAGFDARRIDVFDAQDDTASALPGQQPADQVGARIAQVLRPGRRRGQPRDQGRMG